MDNELTNINEESSCDKKAEYVPEKVMLAKLLELQEFSKIFHKTESTNIKTVEVDAKLQRSMTVCQGILSLTFAHAIL